MPDEEATSYFFPGKYGLHDVDVGKGTFLPHWTTERVLYHVSFRLMDSVPASRLRAWEEERSLLAQMQKGGVVLRDTERQRLKYLFSEKVEQYLDAGHGECLLARPGVAEIVVATLKRGESLHACRLHAYGIMPNHVHVILELAEGGDLEALMQCWKSSSSHRINKVLGRHGGLWQKDYYNHIIRTAREYAFQMDYVYRNDVVCAWRLPSA